MQTSQEPKDSEQPEQPEQNEIRIFGKPFSDPHVCEFVVNRDLLRDASLAVRREQSDRWKGSWLLEQLFEIPGVNSVLIRNHKMTIAKGSTEAWPAIGRRVGDAIRAAFAESKQEVGLAFPPALVEKSAETKDSTGCEAEIERLLDVEINPQLAAHGGRAKLVKIEGTRAFLEMAGGCQGCGMAAQTLRDGIKVSIQKHFPEITDIVDVTDHAAGKNPYA